jgi:transposase-like protein
MIQNYQVPEFRKGRKMTQSVENTTSMTVRAIREFSTDALDADWCRSWVLQHIHGSLAGCPHCDQVIGDERRQETFWRRGRLRCNKCGRYFDAHTGTILAGTSLDYREIYLLAFLLGAGLPVREVSKRLGINESTVRDWRDRLTHGQRMSTHTIGDRGRAARGEGGLDVIVC